MKNKFTLGFMILLVAVLSSCSISFEKRRYRPGYHVETVRNQPDRTSTRTEPASVKEKNIKTENTPSIIAGSNEKQEVVEVTTEPEPRERIKPIEEVKIREKKKRDRDSCDVIFMANGQRVEARVIEITDEYVHYKLCDDPTGRLFSVKSKTIDNITFRNGQLYIPPDRVIVDKEFERKKSQTLFVMSIVSLSVAFIAFVFSFFITPFGVIAFVLAILSGIFSFILVLLDIRPGKYVPSYRTKLTWIFYLIVLVLVIAAMVLAVFV